MLSSLGMRQEDSTAKFNLSSRRREDSLFNDSRFSSNLRTPRNFPSPMTPSGVTRYDNPIGSTSTELLQDNEASKIRLGARIGNKGSGGWTSSALD